MALRLARYLASRPVASGLAMLVLVLACGPMLAGSAEAQDKSVDNPAAGQPANGQPATGQPPAGQPATNPPPAAPSATQINGAPPLAPAALTPSKAAPATPPAPKTEAETKAQDSAGTPATVIDGEQVESLLGKEVQSGNGDNMGRVVDILVDKSGQMRAVVIDFGGFFGVGTRKIAVDWRAIHVPPKNKGDLVVDLPRNQLRVAPVFKDGEPVVVVGGQAAADQKNGAAEPKPVPAATSPAAPQQQAP